MKPNSSVLATKSEPLTRASLQARVDEIGFGPFQLSSIAIAGMALFFSGAIRHYFKVTGGESADFLPSDHWETLGFVTGCAIAAVAARLGRRPAVVIGLVLMGLCSYCASIAATATGVVLHSSFAQVGLGMCLPSVLCMSAEISPSMFKGSAVALAVSLTIVGEIYGILSEKILPPKNFCDSQICPIQIRLECVSVPTVLAAVLAAVFLYESPFALQEDLFSLNMTLRGMERENAKNLSPVNFVPSNDRTRKVRLEWDRVLILGVLLGLAETVLLAVPDTHAGTSAVVGIFGLVVAGVVGVHYLNPRLALIGCPFLISLAAGAGIVSVSHPDWLVVQDSVVFALCKTGALCLVLFSVIHVVSLRLDACERVRTLALAFGIGKLSALFYPLHIAWTTSEVAIAVMAAVAGISALYFLSEEAPEESGRLSERGRFGKIPIVPYGTSV